MSEDPISEIRGTPTRTSDGKAVTKWQARLPDGVTDIVVKLHATRDEDLFLAHGTHPCIKGLEWEGTDLAILRRSVMEDVETRAQRYFRSSWEAATLLEVSRHDRNWRNTSSLALNIELRNLHRDPATPVGNRGETRVLDDGTEMTVFQRAHDQDFSQDRKSMDPASMRLSREEDVTAARVLLTDGARQDARAFADRIEAFSEALMRRCAPDAVQLEGLPGADELVDIMRDAVRAEPGPDEPG